jgi:tRNA/tmRNA/rRNA uracil-C5-methylase (TrmA/RlmC/RlmD family)
MVKKGEVIKIEIEDYAFGGKGIGRLDNDQSIVFVKDGIPGQIVNARITKKKKNYAEASITELIEKSPLQIDHDFQPISGAPYIDLEISEQRNMKQKVCFEVFNKIGKLNEPIKYFDEWISSNQFHHYRNKMEYSFSNIQYDLKNNIVIDDAFSLGFKRKGTWWMVEDLDKDSGLFDKDLEDNLKKIRLFLQKTELPAWHPPKKIGFFRHLVVRKSFKSNQLLFNLVTSSKNIKKFNVKEFGNFLVSLFNGRCAGLIHTINDDVGDREKLDKGNSKLIIGKPIIEENINGLSFEISMHRFFSNKSKLCKSIVSKGYRLS